MRNKNNPSVIAKNTLPKPYRSNFDRGNKVTFSAFIGGFIPVDRYDIAANSRLKLKINTKLDSFPAVSPLYGTLNMRYDVFFCPYRLYSRYLFNNNITEIDEIPDTYFPIIDFSTNFRSKVNWYQHSLDIEPVLFEFPAMGLFIPRGSLLDYLGYPTGAIWNGYLPFTGSTPGPTYPVNDIWTFYFNTYRNPYYNVRGEDEQFSTLSITERQTTNKELLQFNAIPLLGYIDAYTHYIANPQDDDIPFKPLYFFGDSSDVGTKDDFYVNTSLKELQQIIPNVRYTGIEMEELRRRAKGLYSMDGIQYINPYSCLTKNWNPFGAPLPFQSLLSENYYYDLVGEYFENTLTSYYHTGILPVPYKPDYFTTGLNVEDYLQTVTSINSLGLNVETLRLKERDWSFKIRQLISSKRYTDYLYMQYDSDMNLRDYPIYLGGDTIKFAFQDILAQSNTSGDDITDFVGGTAAKAAFNTRAFGNGGMKTINFTAKEPGMLLICARLVPEVNYGFGIDKFLRKRKFVDLYLPQYDAVGFQDISAEELDASIKPDFMSDTIWKVPAFYEMMTSVDKVKGLFNTDGFRSWSFQRLGTAIPVEDDVSSDYIGLDINPSTYIRSEYYDYPFVTAGNQGDNFGIIADIDLKVYQPQSKQIINVKW